MARRTPGRTERQSLGQQIASTLLLNGVDPGTKRVALTLVGGTALALAVALVVFPGLPLWVVGPFLPLLLFANPVGVLVFAGVSVVLGALLVYRDRGSTSSGEAEPSIAVPPLPGDDARGGYEVDRAGERLNTLIGRVTGDAENPSKGVNRAVDKRQVRKQLRDAAVEVLQDAYGFRRTTVQDRIDEGTWTDSRRAAGFLGGPGAPSPTLGTRIRDWAAGKTFERRVHATVDEVVRHSEIPSEGSLLDAPIDRVENRGAAFEGADLREAAESDEDPDLGLDAPGGYEVTYRGETADEAGEESATEVAEESAAEVNDGRASTPTETEESQDPTPVAGDDSDGGSLPDGWVSPGEEDAGETDATDGSTLTEGGEST